MPKSLNEILKKYQLQNETELPSKEVALRRAAYKAADQDVKELLEYGALINDLSPKTGKTALHFAVEKQNCNTIKCLLTYEANYDIEDLNGDTALCLAAKSTDTEMRALFFKKVAEDAFKKIESKYYFEGKKSSDSKKIFNALLAEALETTSIIGGLNTLSRIYLDPSCENGKKSDLEFFKVYMLTELFLNLSVCKKARSSHEKLYNYCQQMCLDLAFELFHFKAFRYGRIPLHIMKYDWPNGINHVILWINYDFSGAKKDTLLCNPIRKKFLHCGEQEIDTYLQKSIHCVPKSKVSILASNVYPDFDKLVAAKDKYKQFFELLDRAYLEESKSAQFKDAICSAMKNFSRQIYEEAQSANSFSLEEALKQFTDPVSVERANSIKKILGAEKTPPIASCSPLYPKLPDEEVKTNDATEHKTPSLNGL